jgi:predicted permease
VIGVFLDVLLPVLLVAWLGSAVATRVGLPLAPLASLTFNVFSPALVFESLRDIRASGSTVGRVVVVVAFGFALAAALSTAWSKLNGEDRETTAAAALCGAVANMGNMGLPIATLAFGARGLDVAVVAFVTASVLTYSGGIVLASLASGTARAALSAPLRVPALWASAAALAVRYGDLPVPGVIEVSAGSLAGAAIPTMLIVLGLQVRGHVPTVDDLRPLLGAAAIRLVVSPLVAAGAVAAVGLGGVAGRTLILLGGMPTAVNTTIIASQYRARPALVTQTVVATTLLSLVSLTALLSVLR